MSDSKEMLIQNTVRLVSTLDDGDGSLRRDLFKALVKNKPLTDEECRIVSVDQSRYGGLIETREQAIEFIVEAARRFGLTLLYIFKSEKAAAFISIKKPGDSRFSNN